jgi:hypothetical protein
VFALCKAQIVYRSLIFPLLKQGESWDSIGVLVRDQQLGRGEEFMVGSAVTYYLNALNAGTGDVRSNFVKAAEYYFQHFYTFLSADALNDWAWSMFKHSDINRELTIALSWSDSAIRKSDKPKAAYLDTYANLLYKVGNKADAIPWEQKAAMSDSADPDIRTNLEKMQNGQPTWDSK